MDEQKWETRLKVLTQVAAICLAGIYVAGFLVVSVYHVRYGIPGFDFLRPRIISAGVLFFLFLAFPLWELADIYNWIKIPPKLSPKPNSETAKTTNAELTPFWIHIYVPTLKVFFFIGASFGIAFVVSLFVTIDANPVTYAWVLSCSLVSGAAYVLSARLP